MSPPLLQVINMSGSLSQLIDVNCFVFKTKYAWNFSKYSLKGGYLLQNKRLVYEKAKS